MARSLDKTLRERRLNRLCCAAVLLIFDLECSYSQAPNITSQPLVFVRSPQCPSIEPQSANQSVDTRAYDPEHRLAPLFCLKRDTLCLNRI